MANDYASAAWAAGNRAERLQARVEALEEELEQADAIIEDWKAAYRELAKLLRENKQ